MFSRLLAIALIAPLCAVAAETKQSDCDLPSFTFHDGTKLPNLRLHTTTLGDPGSPAVLVLHGTGGTGTGLLSPGFGGALFGPGQPLDATRYYVILPDALGAGASAKPSDGLRAAFPRYNYADMVLAQYRVVTECLGVKHLRLVLGNSMGGMNAWVWGVTYPAFVDALVPMASQPSPMAARNWIMRRMLIEGIRQDPAYQAGAYTAQPPSLRLAAAMFGVATNGGTLAWQAQATTTADADRLTDAALAAPSPADANDFVWQWDASRDYDPSASLPRISAAVLAINSADDERNPPETGIMAAALARIPGASLFLIPASTETRGHGTTGMARFFAAQLGAFLAGLPPPR